MDFYYIVIVTTQRNFYGVYSLLIYKASATGGCSRAYMDVFTRPYKSISCVLNSKHTEKLLVIQYYMRSAI